jgi:hypothetical protein
MIIVFGIDAYCAVGETRKFRNRVMWVWKPFLIPIYFIKINTKL